MKNSDNKRGNGEVRERDEESSDGKRYLSHIERTATEPRDESLHTLILNKITPMNATTRLFYLSPPPPSSTSNRPHQEQKTHLETRTMGGPLPPRRTPTSTPTSPSNEEKPSPEKRESEEQGIELAIQRPIFKHEEEGKISEQVTWLFQDAEEILGTEAQVRIGGSFVWPPDSLASFTSSAANVNGSTDLEDGTGIKRIVFIAGGMGINPLISMVGYINSRLEIHGENVEPENEREKRMLREPRNPIPLYDENPSTIIY
ncbi:hypothetical protein DID88_009922 [Monilinia fructigena]|uniref:Ferric reductase NAD binding domain-containing protein n=1 Tax=Monilinia fructigena TaxID=38457 RepID=A0A395IMN3_9HELO|nr:hypothetical protein DID88_009922 [Monilinia fructigena]